MPFPTYLSQHGMIPGIKVDTGAKPLAGFPGETITEGLDGLRERLAEYYKLGARFAKWRAVIDIGAGIPGAYAIDANAEALARYAALCQEAGIVPIVEPEVLMDGDHPMERCEEVTNAVLQSVFAHLHAARILLEGMVLKPNMVIAGKKCAQKASARAGGRSDAADLEAARALGRARHRLFVRRPEPDRGDPAFEPDERRGTVAVGAHLQLRTRAAGDRAARLGRQRRGFSRAARRRCSCAPSSMAWRRAGAYKPSMESLRVATCAAPDSAPRQRRGTQTQEIP